MAQHKHTDENKKKTNKQTRKTLYNERVDYINKIFLKALLRGLVMYVYNTYKYAKICLSMNKLNATHTTRSLKILLYL